MNRALIFVLIGFSYFHHVHADSNITILIDPSKVDISNIKKSFDIEWGVEGSKNKPRILISGVTLSEPIASDASTITNSSLKLTKYDLQKLELASTKGELHLVEHSELPPATVERLVNRPKQKSDIKPEEFKGEIEMDNGKTYLLKDGKLVEKHNQRNQSTR